MRRETKRRPMLPVALAAFIALGAGCAQDLTVDEWKAKRAGEEFERVRAASGTYAGALVSNRDGSVLSPITIFFEPRFRSSDSTDGPTVQQQVVIDGDITLGGERPAMKGFSDGGFDTIRNQFSVQLQIPGRGAAKLSGRVDGGRLTGTLEAQGYASQGGRFDLARLADPAGHSQPISVPLPPDVDSSLFQAFAGQAEFTQGGARAVEMLISRIPGTSEQEFYDFLSPLKSVTVSIRLGQNQDVTFPSVTLDRRTRTLSGEARESAAGGWVVKLECVQAGEGPQAGWKCEYASASYGSGLIFKAHFRPRAAEGARP